MAIISFKHSTILQQKNYFVNAGNTPFTLVLQSFTDDGLTETTNSDGSLTLLKTQNTLIKATFTGDFTSDPDYPFTQYGILFIDVPNFGGFKRLSYISTIEDVRDNSEWIPLVGQNAKQTVNIGPDSVVIEAKLNFNNLDTSIENYRISAELDRVDIDTFCLLQEDGFTIQDETGVGCIEQEH